MKTRPHMFLSQSLCLLAAGAAFSTVKAQQTAPVPPPPPKLSREKQAEAAATIQAPMPLPVAPQAGASKVLPAAPTPPPPVPAPLPAGSATPRTLSPPPVPASPRPSVAPTGTPSLPVPPAPPSIPDASTSKMQALDAATRKGDATVAPRIATPAEKMPVTTSTSSSGQFRVHGKELTTRSAMSSHLDDIAAEMRAVLNDSQPFGQPIVVQLNTGEDARKMPPGTPPVSVVITEVEAASGGGFHLQMTVTESPDLKLSELRRETVRVLLAERIVRGHKTLTKPENRLLLPEWLFNGVLQAMDYRAAARPTTMFAAIFKSGKIYGIEEIIEVSPTQMDSLSRAIYDTSCAALVMALVDQPNGGQRLNKFLHSLAADPRSERELLSAVFPEFAASASSLNKWWALQMATLARRGMAEPLGPDESLGALEEAITIRYHAPEKDAPKDIKPRPFVIPPPLNVIPTDAPKPKPQPVALDDFPGSKPVAATTLKKATDKKSAEQPDETTVEEEKPANEKSSRWLRYLTFGLTGSKKEEKTPDGDTSDESKTEEKKATAADMPLEAEKSGDETPDELKAASGGLFSRLMSRDKLRAAEERQKAADEMARLAGEKATKIAEEKKAAGDGLTEKDTTSKPKPASDKSTSTAAPKPDSDQKPKEEEKGAKAERPSMLNPLNWFRGKKSEGDKPEEPEPAGDKKKAAPKNEPAKQEAQTAQGEATVLFDAGSQSVSSSILEWISPGIADAWQLLAPREPAYTFLDFLKRKKDDKKDEKKEESAAKPAPAPAAKKSETKSRSTPTKSTNPNAQPAARPVKPADGSPRTTNPSAKPVPVPQQPPPATPASAVDTDDNLGKPPPGMVLVTLPVEEYQHVLKRPDRKEILERNIAALRALQLRACVLFRPVVTGYLDVMLGLQEGKAKDMEKRLETLRQSALLALQHTKAVRDYLDWYEANETGRLSGKFDDFLNLPAIIRRELPPREDPISKYLDAIDKQFSK